MSGLEAVHRRRGTEAGGGHEDESAAQYDEIFVGVFSHDVYATCITQVYSAKSSAGLDQFFFFCFPDCKERISGMNLHFFGVAYLTGLPILGYSSDTGKEHVNLVNDQLQKLVYWSS